jgi:NAD(P)-dependent dehydrogenase (short-subunit alcohol dehydrogenase family)
MFDLRGRVALVTGAGQGAGAGIAATLAEAGAAVAVNDLVAERAARTAAALETEGARALAAPFDVTDLSQVERGVAAIAAKLGPVDILVNNAGIPPSMRLRSFRETAPEDWRPYVEVNLYGVLHCVRATLDGMCERRWGRVVTISSGAGQTGLALGVSLYAAGKGGAISFMRHLALETAGLGVTANTLALGLMEHSAGAALPPGLAGSVPVGRLGTGRDVGAAVVWLAAEGAWVTGQTLGINGGALTS